MAEQPNGARVRVNGAWQPLEDATLVELLRRLGHDTERPGVAVALNREVVARSDWSTRTLADGDEVEVVGAVQGG